MIGYLVYLELLSSKPGTYMVQPLFPALAHCGWHAGRQRGRKNARAKVSRNTVAAIGGAVCAGVVCGALCGAARSAEAMAGDADRGRCSVVRVERRRGPGWPVDRWAQISVAALGLFAVTLLAGVLPSIDQIWPARQMERALASCPPSRLGVLGFNEPTSRFVLDRDAGTVNARGLGTLANGTAQGLAVVSDGVVQKKRARVDS